MRQKPREPLLPVFRLWLFNKWEEDCPGLLDKHLAEKPNNWANVLPVPVKSVRQKPFLKLAQDKSRLRKSFAGLSGLKSNWLEEAL